MSKERSDILVCFLQNSNLLTFRCLITNIQETVKTAIFELKEVEICLVLYVKTALRGLQLAPGILWYEKLLQRENTTPAECLVFCEPTNYLLDRFPRV